MRILDTPYKKVFLLLTLFVGGLVWLLFILFVEIFLTNLNGESIWPKTNTIKERPLTSLQLVETTMIH